MYLTYHRQSKRVPDTREDRIPERKQPGRLSEGSGIRPRMLSTDSHTGCLAYRLQYIYVAVSAVDFEDQEKGTNW